MQLTLADYRDHVARIVGLDNSVAGDQGLIDSWVNEGYEDFVRRTECMVLWADLALTDGVDTYTLPSGIMSIKEIVNTGTSPPLERVTLAELTAMKRATSSSPARYYATEGADMLVLYPAPGAGESLTVWYVPAVSPMSSPTSTPTSVPAPFHKAIEFYALARAGQFDQSQSSQFGTFWLAAYENDVRECRKANRQHGGQRTARLRLRKPSFVSSDRSVIRW